MPRDRDGTFEPAIVRKRQRRLSGVDPIISSLSARGLQPGKISAHLPMFKAQPSLKTPSPASPTRSWRRWPYWRGRPP